MAAGSTESIAPVNVSHALCPSVIGVWLSSQPKFGFGSAEV
jgi:hypothetical protein